MCGSGPLHNLNYGTPFQQANDPLHIFGNAAQDKQDQLQQESQQAEQQRQRQITQALNSVNGIFSSPERTGEYDKYQTDTYNLLKSGLDESEKNAARNLKFGLVRTGNIGGSNDADQHGVLANDYYKGLLDASNKAQAAKGQLQSEDQSLWGNVDNLILGGLSATNAEQQATRGLQADAANAQGAATAQNNDQAFGDLASIYANGRAAAGANAANGAPSPTLGGAFQFTAQDMANFSNPYNNFLPQWSPQAIEAGGPS